MPNLKLQHFTCLRDGYSLFQPLDLVFNSGELVQIAGPNGAGKTTLLRAICGLYDDWSGELSWNGQHQRSPTFEVKCNLEYLGHQTGVKKSLTATENLVWFFGHQGLNFPGDPKQALAKVGLSGYEDTFCHQMSAGQMRRVALARFYVSQAPIWVLDEPLTAIDKQGVKHLEHLFEQHHLKGGLVIMTTHQPLNIASVRVVELVPVMAELP